MSTWLFRAPKACIFISYRRADDPHAAARLRDGVTERFGDDRVFIDVAMAPGLDYVQTIEDALDSCAVLLAVIGPRWAGARDDRGRRRLDDPGDIVVREITGAMQKNVPVIPVLIDGTEMPTTLPAELRPLVGQNAERLRHTDFDADLKRLLRSLDHYVRNTDSVAPPEESDPEPARRTPVSGTSSDESERRRTIPATPPPQRHRPAPARPDFQATRQRLDVPRHPAQPPKPPQRAKSGPLKRFAAERPGTMFVPRLVLGALYSFVTEALIHDLVSDKVTSEGFGTQPGYIVLGILVLASAAAFITLTEYGLLTTRRLHVATFGSFLAGLGTIITFGMDEKIGHFSGSSFDMQDNLDSLATYAGVWPLAVSTLFAGLYIGAVRLLKRNTS